MTSWHSYPSLFNIGHPALEELFNDPVLIEEKVDGSQFSFGVFEGQVKCRSKGTQLVVDAPEGMFLRAVESVKERAHLLKDGWTYRGEYLQKPKHNSLAYDRHPEGHVIIFDVNTAEECYLPYEQKFEEAARIGLECVPIMHEGTVESSDALLAFLENISVLGGQKVEGVVIKNYSRFGPDKKALMGKYVSEAFKEVHKGEWKKNNPTTGDVIQTLIKGLRTPARWNKAIQHMAEAGQLTDTLRDIGPFIKEIQADTLKECEEEVKQALFDYAKPQILRGIVHGAPEYYKEMLAKKQFGEDAA
jgi:hypothetical protein